MLEIPESYTLANQMNDTIKGKTISYVQANHSPHSFAWFHGKSEDYDDLLSGKTIGNSNPISGMLEIEVHYDNENDTIQR